MCDTVCVFGGGVVFERLRGKSTEFGSDLSAAPRAVGTSRKETWGIIILFFICSS